MDYQSIGFFVNKTEQPITLFLELTCQEIIMDPNHEIELLIDCLDEDFSVTVLYHNDGLQIYPENIDYSPDWKFKFKGEIYKADYPSILRDL